MPNVPMGVGLNKVNLYYLKNFEHKRKNKMGGRIAPQTLDVRALFRRACERNL